MSNPSKEVVVPSFNEIMGAETDKIPTYDEIMGGAVKKKTALDVSSNTVFPSQSNSEVPLSSDESIPKVDLGEAHPEDNTLEGNTPANENDILGMANYANELNSKTKTIAGRTVKDDEAMAYASGIEKQLKDKGYNAKKIAQDFAGIPEHIFNINYFKKDTLLNDYKENPPLYERKIATIKAQTDLKSELDKLPEGKEIFNQVLSDYNNSDIGDYSQKRERIKGIVNIANQYGGEKKEEILKNIGTDFQNVYAEAAANPSSFANDPLNLKGLNSNEIAAYHLLEDTNPALARKYQAALISDVDIKGNTEAQLQKQEAQKALSEIGIGMQRNFANEKLQPLQKEYKQLFDKAQNTPLTLDEEQRMRELEAKGQPYNTILENIDADEKNLAANYPKAAFLDANNFAQELVGQKHTGLDWLITETGKATGNTVTGIGELVKRPFLSDHANEINQAEILGGNALTENSAYLKQSNQTTQTFKPTVSPELQKDIDLIKNDESLSKREKIDQVSDLLMNRSGEWQRTPIAGGKSNIGIASMMYGIGGLAANLAPFIVAEMATGGGATAGTGRKFISAFTSAAATGFHDSYVQALDKGSENPFADAARVTAINSAALAGAGTPDAIRKMLGTKTAIGKLISGMTDESIEAALKETPKALSKFSKILDGAKKGGKIIADAALEGFKGGAKVTAFTTAGQMVNDAIGGEFKPLADYGKQAAIETLKFGIFGTIGGTIGKALKKPSDISLSALTEFGKNPESGFRALENMEKDGSISPTDAAQVRSNIEKAAKVFKSSPILNNEGLGETAKREYLYNEMVKNDALETAKSLPTKQSETATRTAEVAEHKNSILLEQPTPKQLESRKAELEKKLIPEKDADGKEKSIPDKLKKDTETELQAVNEIIEDHSARVADENSRKLSQKKSESEFVDTKPSIPIEGTDEQGIPVGDNVPPPVDVNSTQLKDINDVEINVGDKVKTRQPGGGVLPSGESVIGTVEKTKDALGNDALQIRYRDKGKDFDQFILLNGKENEIMEQANPTKQPINEQKTAKIPNTKKKGSTINEEPTESIKTAIGEEKSTKENEVVPEDETMRLSHADTEKTYKEQGLPERMDTPTKSNAELEKEATDLVKKGYDFEKVADKIMNGEPYSFEDVDQVAFTKEVASLKKKQEGMDINSEEFDKIQNRIEKLSRASDVVGTIGGRFLQSRKVSVGADETLSDYVMKEKELNNNAPLTEGQKETVQKEYNEISAAEQELQQKVALLEAENAKLKAEKQITKIKTASPRTKKAHEDFVEERKRIASAISEKLKKSRGELNAVPIPYLKELITIAPEVGKLVKSYVEEGIVKLEEIVKKVHDELKSEIPELQEKDIHDIIAGEYNPKKQTKNQIAEQLFNLKLEAKLVNKYEALLKGEKPKNEKARIKRNQEVEKLRQQIKDFETARKDAEKTENAEPKKTPEEIAVQSIKTRTQKQIEQLEEDLSTGKFDVPEKKEPLKLDKGTQALQDKLIKLKNERQLRILKAEYENSSKWNKIQTGAANVIGIPRTLMASVDYSAPLRQALLPTIAHPVMASKAAVEMFKASLSQKVYDRWFDALQKSDRFSLMQDSHLALTDVNNPKLAAKEEQFMNGLAEKIPFIGKLIKGSERAYTIYLNKMRVDLFNRFADQMQKDGRTFQNSKEEYKQMASFVNNMTGRGDMGKTLNESAPILNQLFFSPRLAASRINTLTYMAQPRFWSKMPVEVRKDYFKSLVATAGLGLTILALAKLGGAETEDDPTSPDFGKIKSGNTRWDIWGGHQQYIRLVAQMVTGRKKSSTSGAITEMKPKDRFIGSGFKFLRGKLSPVPSLLMDVATQENMLGDKLTTKWKSAPGEIGIGENLASHLLPLTITGLNDALKDQGSKGIFTVGVPSIFGVGTQTYSATEKKLIKSQHRTSK